ncbi:hypothetical protein LZ32DRAFT_660728 [Colletotrichum eremochloae]|nr:hypothetical protein LZ32DRAFT_660728 [Colletotrichum eremochloae]
MTSAHTPLGLNASCLRRRTTEESAPPVLTGSMSERTTEDPMTRSSAAAPLHFRVRMAQERAMERGILRYVADKVWRVCHELITNEASPAGSFEWRSAGSVRGGSGGRSSAPKPAMRRSSSGTASPPPPPPAPLALWPGAFVAGFWNGDFAGARSKACRPRRSRRHGPGASLCARLGGSGFRDPMGPETLIGIHVGVLSDFYCDLWLQPLEVLGLRGGSRSGGPLRRLPR